MSQYDLFDNDEKGGAWRDAERRFHKLVNNNKLGGGHRFNLNKPRMSLVPHAPIRMVAEVLSDGACKYGDHNWRGGLSFTGTIDSIERHLGAFKDGEDYDQESGLHHLAHAMTNIMFLLQFIEDGMDYLDDRYKKDKEEVHTVEG